MRQIRWFLFELSLWLPMWLMPKDCSRNMLTSWWAFIRIAQQNKAEDGKLHRPAPLENRP